MNVRNARNASTPTGADEGPPCRTTARVCHKRADHLRVIIFEKHFPYKSQDEIDGSNRGRPCRFAAARHVKPSFCGAGVLRAVWANPGPGRKAEHL